MNRIVILAAMATSFVSTPSYAESRLFFPRVTMLDSRFNGIAIANSGTTSAPIRITAYTADGALLAGGGIPNPVEDTIPAGAQYARLAREIFAPPSVLGEVKVEVPFWVEVTSPVSGLTGYFLEGSASLRSMDGGDVTGAGTDLILPGVLNSPTASTEISLLNTDDGAASVIIDFHRADGSLSFSRMVELAPRAALQGGLPTFFDSSADDVATLHLRSDRPVVCYGFVSRPADESLVVIPARATAAAVKTMSFPRLIQGQQWSTTIGLVNVSDSSVLVKITALQPDGRLYSAPVALENPVSQSIPPHGSLRGDLSSLFSWDSSSLDTGWIKVEASSAALTGYAEYVVGSARALVPAPSGTHKKALVPHQVATDPFFSRLAILNAGSLTTNVEIISLNNDSSIAGRTQRVLKAGQSEDLPIEEWIRSAAGVSGGSIFIKSDGPILASAILGTSGYTEIANVPPTVLTSDYDPGTDLPRLSLFPPIAVIETGKSQKFLFAGATGGEWSVNGVPGGSTTVGTISAAGIYTAPKLVPEPRNLSLQISNDAAGFSVGANVDIVSRETLVSALTLVTAVAYVENLQRFFIAEQQILSSSPDGARTAAAANSVIRERTKGGSVVPYLDLPNDTIGKMLPFVDANGKSWLLVAGTDSGTLYRLDIGARQLSAIVTGLARPTSMALDPTTRNLLIAESAADQVTLIPRAQYDPTASETAARRGARAASDPGTERRALRIASPQGVVFDDATGAMFVTSADGSLREFLGSRERIVVRGLDLPSEMLVLHRAGVIPRSAGTSILVCERNRISQIYPSTGLVVTFLADLVNVLDLVFLPDGNPFSDAGVPTLAAAQSLEGPLNSSVLNVGLDGIEEESTAAEPPPAETGPALPYHDPAGDVFATELSTASGLEVPDVLTIDATKVGDSVVLEVGFAGPIASPSAGAPNSVYGSILIDTLSGSGQGEGEDPYNPFGLGNGLSVNGVIDLESATLSILPVSSAAAAEPRTIKVPVFYLGTSLTVTVPGFAFDIATSRIAARFGNRAEVTDVVPNQNSLAVEVQKSQAVTVQFAAAASGGSSSTTRANLEVTLSAYSSEQVKVNYAVTGGSAEGGGVDFTLAPGTLVFEPGETKKSLVLLLAGRRTFQPDLTIQISLSSPVAATLGSPATHVYTIRNVNPEPTVAFAESASSGPESKTAAGFAIVLSNDSASLVTVRCTVSGGTAKPGTDFSFAPALVTFNPGETRKEVTITVNDNNIHESDKTVELKLSEATGATLGRETRVYTIVNDDPVPTVSFQSGTSVGAESQTTVPLSVVLSNPTTDTVTVSYAVTGGTATGNGVDFALAPGTLTFPPLSTAQSISLTVIDDRVPEQNETVVVTLSSPQNATLGSISVHTYTIQDNDSGSTLTLTPSVLNLPAGGSGSMTLTLSAAAGPSGLSVTLNSDNTAAAGVPASVTVAGGATSATVQVTAGTSAGTANITATAAGFASASAQVVVSSGPGISLSPSPLNIPVTETGTLTVTLSAPAGAGGLTVTLSSDNTGAATLPGSVSIPGGATSATVTVTAGSVSGSATVTASGSGYTSGTVQVVVSPRTMSIGIGPLVGLGRVLTGSVTLSHPAPAGGVTASIQSSNTGIATVSPPTVTIPAGATAAAFSLTGVAVGDVTITADAVNYVQATANVTVTASSLISLGSGLVVAPGQSRDLALSIGIAAPAGGVTVNMTTSDPSIATVTPNVFIPAGFRVPSANPQVTGVGFGTVVIGASATGFAPDTTDVTITVTATLSPTNFHVIQGRTSNITLNISAPAPAGGLTLNLSIDNTSLATVPATVTVSAGSTSAQVPVTGVAVGNTNLRAAGTGIAQTTASVAVDPTPPINMQLLTIGKDLQVQSYVQLGAAAPAGGTTVALTGPAGPAPTLLFAANSTTPGAASMDIFIPAGQTTAYFYIQALAGTGTAQVTATAPLYLNGTSTVTFTPSGFIVDPRYLGNFTTTTLSANTTVYITSARLAPTTYQLAAYQALRPGLTASVPVTSSDTNVGTITTSPVVFDNAAGTLTTAFDPSAQGSATIAVGTVSGFDTPSNYTTITATVNAPNISISNVSVGRDLQTSVGISLAVTPPSPVTVTITIQDTNLAVISSDPAVAGSGTVTFTNVTSSFAGTVYVQGLAVGSTAMTVQAAGYNNGANTVQIDPSGFIIDPRYLGNFTTTTFSPNTTIWVTAARLSAASGQLAAYQQLRPGVTANVPVTSSDINVGTITTSPLVFANGAGTLTTAFDPATQGTATIAVGTPAGFDPPSNYTQITATVNAPNISIANVSVGRDLQTTVSVSLGVTPPSPVTVTVTIQDTNLAVISSDPAVAGTGTVTFANVTSSFAGTVYVQGLAVGSTVMTVQAAGYNNAANTVQIDPSGFIIDPRYIGNFTTTTFSANTTIWVTAARLNPTSLLLAAYQQLRPGVTASVPVTSTDTNVGAITTSPLDFINSAITVTTAFTPRTAGTANISVGTPSGFSTPANYTQITATVNAPNITVPNVSVGRDLQVPISISLAVAPPSPITVTVTSSNASLVLITPNSTAAGTNTVTFTNVSGTFVGTVYVQGLLDQGSVSIVAQAAGYNDGSGSAVLGPSGFIIDPRYLSSFTTTAQAANTTVRITAARLDSFGNLAAYQALRGGLSASVPVTSSNTAVGVITTSPVDFSGGTATAITEFDPLTAGSTVISVLPPVGSPFSTPSNYAQVTATVTP